MKKVINRVEILDDLDRKSAAVGSYALSFDGRAVMIDLGEDNLRKLRDFLKPYLRAGVRTDIADAKSSPEPAVAVEDDPFSYNRRTKHFVIAAFAKAHGLAGPRHHDKKGTKGNATWYYPHPTMKEFEEARREYYERQAEQALTNGAGPS
jgi:hypothetical protein